ncbi:Rrf2 family transcriptional regulator [Sphingobacterium sp. DR205]|uniref:RrF2 family transcriptional regulator n=1 Tax=Sphingobacterium sp. DR205 TaxID=2713573 RepID=UPI003216F4E9
MEKQEQIMGIFSKTCEYGLRAVFFIAQRSQENKRVGIKEIAENIHSPEAFLGKILQNLSRAGIIRSMKGPGGGFYLDASDMSTPLSDVVKAIDGENLFVGCGMGLEFCSEQYPCPLHHEFKSIRNSLSEMLQKTTVGQFNDDLIKGKILLTKSKVAPNQDN